MVTRSNLTPEQIEDLFNAGLFFTPVRVGYVRGLYITATKSVGGNLGSMNWAFRYMKHGSRHLLTIGNYPTMSLTDAINKAEEMRLNLKRGLDLKATRKIETIPQHRDFILNLFGNGA